MVDVPSAVEVATAGEQGEGEEEGGTWVASLVGEGAEQEDVRVRRLLASVTRAVAATAAAAVVVEKSMDMWGVVLFCGKEKTIRSIMMNKIIKEIM